MWISPRLTIMRHASFSMRKNNKYRRRPHTLNSHTQIFLNKKHSPSQKLPQNLPQRFSHRPTMLGSLTDSCDASRYIMPHSHSHGHLEIFSTNLPTAHTKPLLYHCC